MFSLLSLVVLESILSRMSGGGLGAKYLDVKGYKDGKMPINMTWLPEALFSLPIAILSTWGMAALISSFILLAVWFLFAWFVSYICVQTSHGENLEAKFGDNPEGVQNELDGRDDRLAVIIRKICNILKLEVGGKVYCTLFWMLKGFLIALPLGIGYAMFHAIFWVLGYYIGYRLKNHSVSELSTGAGTGVVLWMKLTDLLTM